MISTDEVGNRLENPALLIYEIPIKPWKGMRWKRRWEVDGLPPLQTLHLELNVLRALWRNPSPHLTICRFSVLSKNRWIAAERVARAALRDGYSKDATFKLIKDTYSEFAPAEFTFVDSISLEIVESQSVRRQEWVIYPGGRKGSPIIGVSL